MIDAIICDWNRTLFEDQYEEIFFGGIFKHVVFENIKKLNAKKLMALVRVKNECIKQYRFKDGKVREGIIHIVEKLNDSVIKGLPVTFIDQYTKRYAVRAINRLDSRILAPLKKLHVERGIRLGIISSGYITGIRQILEKAGYIFDVIMANDFETSDNAVVRFQLSIFDNKLDVLQKILSNNRMRSNNAVYIGDDMQDEACFKAVGYPIVSFLATDYYKNYFFKNVNAFVPNNADEFESYLRKITGSGG